MKYGSNESECQQIVQRVQARFPDLMLQIDEDMDEPGFFYIYVISVDYSKPDLKEYLPADWLQTEWRNPDQRAEICLLEKRRR